MTAPGTNVPGLFVLNPLFGPPFSPMGYGSHNNLLADRHWKVLDVPAREIITFMATLVPLGLGAVSYDAFSAKTKGSL